MSGNRSAAWVLGAVLLTFVMLAATWLLAVSPRLENAGAMVLETEMEQSRLDQLEMELASLREDFENLDAFQAELETLRVQIPSERQLADLTRNVAGAAERSGVTILDLTPAVPTAVLAVAEAAPAAEVTATDGTTTGDTGTEGTEGAEATPTAPTQPTPVPGFYAMPLSITVLGSYDAALAFVDELQEALPRLVLVSGINVAAQEQAPATGGRPAVNPGDVELVANAFAFTLTDAAAPAAQPAATPSEEAEEASEGASLPVPAGQENLFAPLH